MTALSADYFNGQISKVAKNYQTPKAVKERLSRVILVPLIGPFATGKTTVMMEMERVDSEFCRLISFTTRHRRPDDNDDTYRFLPHDTATLQYITKQFERQAIVQCVAHPTTKNIYGTEINDYAKAYCVLDTLPNALEALCELPFKTIKKVALVTEPWEWHERFKLRVEIADSTADLLKRVTEGISNLEWSLRQPRSEITWINNSGKSPRDTATEIISAIKYDTVTDDNARNIGAELLQKLQSIQRELSDLGNTDVTVANTERHEI